MTAVDATTFGYAVLDTVGELCSNPLQRMSVQGTAKVLEEVANKTGFATVEGVLKDISKGNNTAGAVMDIIDAAHTVKGEGFNLTFSVNKLGAAAAATGGVLTLTHANMWKGMPAWLQDAGFYMSRGGVATMFANKVVTMVQAKTA
ncbi:MAG: hypothetical protein GWP59_02815 [Chlamydiales bacterium]|nr:hypothetical protein [Chlamydiales bacterium]